MYEEDNSARNMILGGLGAVFVIALIGIYFFVARKPAAIAAPSHFTPYTSADKSFACLAPDGWQRQEAAAGGIMGGVSYSKATAKIKITSDLEGSLMGDIAAASNAQLSSANDALPPGMQPMNMPQRRPPVEQLHLAGKDGMAGKLKEYQEQPMKELTSPLGEGRISEFTGDAGFSEGGKVHGYRATILNGDRRVTLVCQCRETDWPALQPAFRKIVLSLALAAGG